MAHHGQAQTPTYWHASHKTSACDTCLHHGYVGSKFTLENADGARCIQSGLFRGSSRFIPVKVLRASEGSYAIGIGQISEDADVVAVRKQSMWVHAIRMLMINGSWPDAWSHLFSYWRRTAILWFRRKHTYRGYPQELRTVSRQRGYGHATCDKLNAQTRSSHERHGSHDRLSR